MITELQAQQLLKLIENLVEAEVAYSWKGGGHPDDLPIIEADRTISRAKLEKFINDLKTS